MPDVIDTLHPAPATTRKVGVGFGLEQFATAVQWVPTD